MESKRTRKLFNIIMAAIILVIAMVGILVVGNIKGWFKDSGSALAKGENVYGVVSVERSEAFIETEEEAAESEAVGKGDRGSSGSDNNNGHTSGEAAQGADKPATDDKTNSDQGATEPENSEAVPTAKTCTIEIRCDTVLNNMDKIKDGKEGYVPGDGTILKTTTVEFEEGETVFDVLERVCSSKGIQLEYSWSPVYGSSYIEGINHLYEYDCGDQSGWIFKVNGWSPNYGASAYYLEDGDSIKWLYSCVGYGADVS